MKLYGGTTSPFVRKVLVVAHELGVSGDVDLVTVAVSPVSPDANVNALNPLGKIPALLTEDDVVLYDSAVICEYLDTRSEAGRLFPTESPRRWVALRRQAACDGLLDAAVNARYETALRPESQRWSAWSDGQIDKCLRVVGHFEGEAQTLGEVVDIGTISLGCALGYLDFRYAHLAWRDAHPKLASWYERFAARPSMQKTQPHE